LARAARKAHGRPVAADGPVIGPGSGDGYRTARRGRVACPSEVAMICGSCGTENPSSNRFCEHCGSPLAATCPTCGSSVSPTARFCGNCGTGLTGQTGPLAPSDGSAVAEPVKPGASPTAERRLVSVLFGDLVGFTPIAESRDSEEVRDILSSYFDRARLIVERHGGTVEKFIGDAVMAVWGTPVAHEDDAERAVRAGLAVTAAVELMNAELHLPEQTLALRVAVLTGEAAITVGAEGQGMVAGDLVNTASRVQSVAPPGTVLVDEATRRTTEAAIAFEEAGAPSLKGKRTPIPVWRALRVVGGLKGTRKALGLEAPFVGREEQLRMVTELFHSTVRERRARLVSVMGIAGIGKSRLSWEFEKYCDGLADTIWWHRGRCLAYGEGVTYWALAEMVRSRARILEEESSDVAARKLEQMLAAHVPDPEEREWVEPRLAHLLSLDSGSVPDRQELFAAWRLFFERLAEQNPVVMVFEDLQWADVALIDFIEYLLDWSRSLPLYILVLARPELTERRPGWGATTRAFTSLYLDPLRAEAMEELLRGMVPGLPDDLVIRIGDRSEGVPLYAVETVRMLLDRGLLQREGSKYVITGNVQELEVPESLQSLIAARLDGLGERERAVFRDASVLGKTFTREAVTAVSGLPEKEIDTALEGLVRKELLTVETDPLSPERGQHAFLQDLVRRVAYETLSKKERKSRHLAVARYLEQAWSEEDEVVQIVASHYLDAYTLQPDAPDAPDTRARARGALTRAGERAATLGGNDEGQRYFERALALADEPFEKAMLLERAGDMANAGARSDEAVNLWERAIAGYEGLDRPREAARVTARLATLLWEQGQIETALERMERAFQELSGGQSDESVATVAVELARLHHFHGDNDRARERLEVALEIAEDLGLWDVLSHGLNTKYLALSALGRQEEGSALLKHSLEIALEHDLNVAALRAFNNLAADDFLLDRYEIGLERMRQALAFARKLGSRPFEWQFLAQSANLQRYLGLWDEVMAAVQQIPRPDDVPGSKWPFGNALWVSSFVLIHRGELERIEQDVAMMQELVGASSDVQTAVGLREMQASLAAARGDHVTAVRLATESLETWTLLGLDFVRESFALGAEGALALGDVDAAEGLVRRVEGAHGRRSPWTRGHIRRFRARIAAARVEEGVEPEFKAAAAMFREIRAVFALAVVLLEYGEWLAASDRGTEAGPLIEEARAIFERLRAKPWLERVTAAESQLATAAV
jgi:class 3 adenylate cyclase/tetratricopeptide (TPR) repeat protein